MATSRSVLGGRRPAPSSSLGSLSSLPAPAFSAPSRRPASYLSAAFSGENVSPSMLAKKRMQPAQTFSAAPLSRGVPGRGLSRLVHATLGVSSFSASLSSSLSHSAASFAAAAPSSANATAAKPSSACGDKQAARLRSPPGGAAREGGATDADTHARGASTGGESGALGSKGSLGPSLKEHSALSAAAQTGSALAKAAHGAKSAPLNAPPSASSRASSAGAAEAPASSPRRTRDSARATETGPRGGKRERGAQRRRSAGEGARLSEGERGKKPEERYRRRGRGGRASDGVQRSASPETRNGEQRDKRRARGEEEADPREKQSHADLEEEERAARRRRTVLREATKIAKEGFLMSREALALKVAESGYEVSWGATCTPLTVEKEFMGGVIILNAGASFGPVNTQEGLTRLFVLACEDGKLQFESGLKGSCARVSQYSELLVSPFSAYALTNRSKTQPARLLLMSNGVEEARFQPSRFLPEVKQN
ncbi:putative glutamic acid-rcih protein [Besnoitia besnoiti]|uniref:Putative glutamic acid-rcih protein n=1 Tax=Besnoitia besnoiti TaxID=94643 RepID=A0A2A9M8E1_BESBE|nr:putative glutamic acid-rcih protein [Besnoitia besnoiti]PFH31907.1 putative glutamic acid-rcih protein [Besnoitia besnoiti]